MGRYKVDKFDCEYLSEETLRAIMADLAGNGVDINDYDCHKMNIQIKRADKARRHRFADTLRKLENYVNTEDAKRHIIDIYCNREITSDCAISIREFADITGRNRKTVTDWIERDFIASAKKGLHTFILVMSSIEKLKKI
jgi:hypothetical protein